MASDHPTYVVDQSFESSRLFKHGGRPFPPFLLLPRDPGHPLVLQRPPLLYSLFFHPVVILVFPFTGFFPVPGVALPCLRLFPPVLD